MLDDLYHCCRWCHSYTDGKCWRGIADTESATEDRIYEIAESGRLSGVLEESLNSASRKDFERELGLKLKEYRLSDKRIKEFLGLFNDCMNEFLDFQCKPICDDNVSFLYQNIPQQEAQGVVIADPDNFYCRYFE